MSAKYHRNKPSLYHQLLYVPITITGVLTTCEDTLCVRVNGHQQQHDDCRLRATNVHTHTHSNAAPWFVIGQQLYFSYGKGKCVVTTDRSERKPSSVNDTGRQKRMTGLATAMNRALYQSTVVVPFLPSNTIYTCIEVKAPPHICMYIHHNQSLSPSAPMTKNVADDKLRRMSYICPARLSLSL